MAVFISVTRYKYFMADIFDGSWLEVSEDFFDDCVVRFRNCYDLHYENHAQVFYNIDTGCPEFKRVPIGEGYCEV